MRPTRLSIILFVFYFIILSFWLSAPFFLRGNLPVNNTIFFTGFKNSTKFGYLFAFAYAFIPLFGSIVGFTLTQKWGFSKSSVGKSVFFLSMSLLSWTTGEFIWSYYNFFLNANVPYPSWADAGFVLNYPFLGIGMIYLGIASGAKLGLEKTGRKLLLFLIPLLVSLLSWYVMVVIARGGSLTSGGGMLKVFFDIAYPAGDVILLTIGFLIFGLSFRYWGAQIKLPVIVILIGILLEYVADFGFSYTTTVNTFYNGSWVDLTYATSLAILSFGVILLDVNKAPSIATTVANTALIPSPPSASSVPPTPDLQAVSNAPSITDQST